MNFIRCISPILAIAAVHVEIARAEETFGELAERSLEEINAEKWPDALSTLDLIIEKFGAGEPLESIGPQFGAIYFRKGLCEMKLKKWPEAARSFEACYRGFPNPAAAGQGNGNTNVFQKRALLKWGEAAMGAGQWELAISRFLKFVEERDKKLDTYPAGAFYVNLAVCHYKLGNVPEGNLNLEIAIANKDVFPTPDAGIVAGFEALVGAAIAGRKEQALLDFIQKNRGEITFEPREMSVFSGVYMKLGADAFAAGMSASALAIYQLVPSSEAVIDDLRARISALRADIDELEKKALEARLAAIEAEYRGPSSSETIKLAATALIHEKLGNLRGAHAAYQQLVAWFPEAARREDYLFNLIRLGALLDQPGETIAENTAILTQEFPASPSVPAARQLGLSSLFQAGKYQEALAAASALIGGLKEGSPEHDFCLHLLGASYYYTNQNGKARPLLDEHATTYPDSPHSKAALYFRASNLAKLREWDECLPLLDDFLAKFPDPAANRFLPFALYDRAACHFGLGENAAALADISRLEKEFPGSPVSENALALEGKIHAAGENADAAKKAFLKALELAEARKNRVVSGEILLHLVSLLAERSPKEAILFADRFWKDPGEKSTFSPQVAIAQIRPLAAMGRGEEALSRLRSIIAELAKSNHDYALESTISAYAAAYLADHEPDALQKHFDAFPGVDPTDQATRALLRMAIIRSFETVTRKSPDEAAKNAARLKILSLFQELKTSLAAKELPTPILLNLADHLREYTSAPREALPFYEEAISRNEQTYRFPSLFGRGDTYSRSGFPEEMQKGIDDFEVIFRQSKNRDEREYALFRMIEIRVAMADYKQAIDDATRYLDPKARFTKFTAEVGLFLARSHQETGDLDAAISAYSKVWSVEKAPVRITAFAIKTWLELLWNRNQPGDRNIATESGARYLEATRPLAVTMTPEESALWKEIEQLVATQSVR